MEDVSLPVPEYKTLIDRIINVQRKNDAAEQNQEITDQERQQVIREALKIYEQIWNVRRRKDISSDTKIYVEYKLGLTKMTEELDSLF
jgi:hypothetical protein